ncbi:MAG TPA: response regulator transcription factor [Vicinamibacterales bacterium]|nr:response regulator transcription factor [Vicinamibacterales bacterium]
MRVLLVGDGAERARLRAQMNGSMVVVAEYATLAAARAAAIDADAILVSRPGTASAETDGSEPFAIEETLTPREVQVLELLAEGLANKGIAERLGISDQTVKFHVASISGKLGAVNRTDAVRRAVRRGLITL